MPKYVETADDLNKKYHGTFVKYKGAYALMTNFIQVDTKQISGQIVYEGKKTVNASEIEIDQIEPITFDSMFVNNEDLNSKAPTFNIPATLFLRLPKRQWRRGLSVDNTKLKCPLGSLYTTIGRTLDNFSAVLTHRLLTRLENPEYPSLAQAVKLVDHFQAIALSPMFALCLSNISKDRFLIASIFGFIGEATDRAIYVKHPPILQELRDYISRTNQSVSVEVV